MVKRGKIAAQIGDAAILSLPSVKDLASCFSEHAVRVSDASCSGSSGSGGSGSSVVAASSNPAPSTVAVTNTYLSRETAARQQQPLLVTVTWSKVPGGGSTLSVGVDGGASQLLRKSKGNRALSGVGDSAVVVFWDVSGAKYGASPEPVSGFYLVVMVGAEFALLVGDMCASYINKKLGESAAAAPPSIADFSLIGKKERVHGRQRHSTTARFRHDGGEHEITIVGSRREGPIDAGSPQEWELTVSLDGKPVVHVEKLKWNFRGNQTIFVDGAPVDVMWDVHDWWFSAGAVPGYGVFLLRARSALDRRLWLEEESVLRGELGVPCFALVVQAMRIP